MIRCSLCMSPDIVKATIKKTGKKIAFCRECCSVYEVKEDGKPVFDHDPYDTEYFKKLNSSFGSIDELDEISPYNTFEKGEWR